MTETSHEAAHHLVNWVTLLSDLFAPSAFSEFLIRWETTIFSATIIGLISFFFIAVSRKLAVKPGRLQVVAESLVTGLDDLVTGILGPGGRAYTPFVGSLFLYILALNLFGVFPLQNSPTAYITTTAPLAIAVFLYVQWVGIRTNGPLGYLYHMAGSPNDVFGWFLVPLNLPLHILGEFVKPISLMFRLFGNIMAGHLLLAVFASFGVKILASFHIPAGVPLHFPFLFLEILIGTVQAFVFALLSTVYIGMMLPHGGESRGSAIESVSH